MADVLLNVQFGLSSGLASQAVQNGTLRVTTDSQKLFVDINNARLPLCDVVMGNTEAQIKTIVANQALPKVYLASDTLNLWFFDTTVNQETSLPKGWTQVGSNGTVERASKDGAGNVITETYETISSAQSRQDTLQGNIDALAAVVGAINSFEYQIIDDIAHAPVPGASNIIYFVVDNSISTNPDVNVYREYLWITTQSADPDQGTPAVGHYEIIGTTETDLTNYYTKSEADALYGNLWTALGLTASDIDATGFQSVNARLTALEGDSTDADAIAEIQAKIGADYPASTDTDFVSISARLTAEEAATSRFDAELGTLDSTAQGYQTVATRLSNLESADTEFSAKLGDYAASTDAGFVSVEDRFTAVEGRATALETEVGAATNPDAASLRGRMATAEDDITEINAKLGNMAASTDTGFVSVEGRLTALEGDSTDADAIAEIQAQLGNYPASTADDFVSVADRFTAVEGRATTLESDVDTAEADIDEIQAQLGAYPASSAQGFTSVADRFTADESNISALQTEVGAATNPDAASLRGRMAAEEAATSRLDAELGTLDSTATGYVTVADRLAALEGDQTDATAIAELEAKFGAYADSTATGFVSVEDRFAADETAISGAEADIDEIQAQLGNYPASTAQGFTSVADRFTAVEGRATTLEGNMTTAQADIDELEAKFGTFNDSTAQGFTSVETRFTTNEADITELNAKIGTDYPASTDAGFKSINTRLTELVSAIGNINKFDIVVIRPPQTLPVTGESYVIYFVPIEQGADNNDGHTKYVEYMWVADNSLTAGGYYEEIGITEADLDEYYTSAEVDALLVTERGRISTLEAAIGTVDPTAAGYVTIMTRLGTAESDIDELEAKFGAYAASTASGFTTVENRFAAIEADTAELHAQIGALDSTVTGFQTVDARVTTNTGDIAEINAKLGNMAASTDTGFVSVEDRLSAIEGGAVTQSEDTDDAEKPLLVSGDANHSTVEYVSGVTVNANSNTLTADGLVADEVTATTATATEVVLGDATLTFDSSTGALVINF